MDFDFTQITAQDRYRQLTNFVDPRPIALVFTLFETGQDNAAPMSFFNVFSHDPAIVVLGIQTKADGQVGQANLILQAAHQVENLRLHRYVQGRGQLVTDQKLGFGRKGAGDQNALALAAENSCGNLRPSRGGKADGGQQFADAFGDFGLGLAQFQFAQRFGDDVKHPPAGG